MKVLITGAQGFIGSNFAAFLNKKCASAGGTAATDIKTYTTEFNVLKENDVAAILQNEKPEVILHLAGISAPAQAQKELGLTWTTNLIGTCLLARKAIEIVPQCHFIFPSTAQVYDFTRITAENKPVDEKHPIAPGNYYAESKWLGELALKDFSHRHGSKVTVLRLFNHTHKSQRSDFFLPTLYQNLLKAKAGDQIPVGNLDLYRDMGGISDLLQALYQIVRLTPEIAMLDRLPVDRIPVEQRPVEPRPMEPQGFKVFNVCSGKPRHLLTLAKLLVQTMRCDVSFITDPSRLRIHDPNYIVGSHDKLTQYTGWNPQINTDQQLIDNFLSEL